MSNPHPSIATSNSVLSRRDFLAAAAVGTLGIGLQTSLSLTKEISPLSDNGRAAILIVNVGGPSQLDTFDPKPDAPAEIRGPFRTITTRVPGLFLSELLPLHAQLANRFSLVRSCHHTAPAVHDLGHQLAQTGRTFGGDNTWPQIGSVVKYLGNCENGYRDAYLLPEPIQATGGNLPHGQGAAFLGRKYDPLLVSIEREVARESLRVRERYGSHRLGQSCLRARQLIELGARFVTINAFSTVFNQPTWDVHGHCPFSNWDDLQFGVAPQYDQAYTALLEDLEQRGLLEQTLVCSVAEFGRTPRINATGGRDHWPHCWTTGFAGGGVQGGRVIGQSDACGGYPIDRPVTPGDILATIYLSLGIDPDSSLRLPDGRMVSLLEPDAQPLYELF